MGDALTFLPISESSILKSLIEGTISRLDNFFGNWLLFYFVALLFSVFESKTPSQLPVFK